MFLSHENFFIRHSVSVLLLELCACRACSHGKENSAVFANFDGQEHLHSTRWGQVVRCSCPVEVARLYFPLVTARSTRHCYNALHAQPAGLSSVGLRTTAYFNALFLPRTFLHASKFILSRAESQN